MLNVLIYEGVGFLEGFKFWASDFLFDVFVPYEGPAPGEVYEPVLVVEEGEEGEWYEPGLETDYIEQYWEEPAD